ncbi:MAG TPA: SciE type virulence protein [Planctomycetaceae bacterium]|jgi:type VI secretion system protein ImpE|nr:SciE type virulence protein [Planctomycetaceae bacterium]HAA50917.1 SciE type virulence protein [Planctomycetaceae bacterium]HCK55433.1 SciE type virulence protein [Planctomycetaceae bacterium]
MTPVEHFQAGDLTEAINTATEAVKKDPTDTSSRSLMAQLLCFAGELERADSHLDAIGQQDPAAAVGAALVRHLIRGEQARQQCFQEGRLPELLQEPSMHMQRHLEALVCLREDKLSEAADLLGQAEELRPRVSGTCNDDAFDDLRDLDDLTSGFLETITSNGKYYWVPLDQIRALDLRQPERSLDLLWQPAHMVVEGGPDGDVYLPVMYAGSHEQADDRLRLGLATEWTDGETGPVRGIGQRELLVGENVLPILQIKNLTIAPDNATD